MKKQFLILFAFISVLALSQVPQRFNKVIVTGDITSPKFIKTGSNADSVLLGNGSARSVNSLKTDTVSLSNRINAKATGNGTANGTNTGDETLTSIKTKLGAASLNNSGYLTNTDWSVFYAKQNSLVFGNLTTSTNGVSVTNGAGAIIGAGTAINITTASASSGGLLSTTDWNNFNNKQPSGSYEPSFTKKSGFNLPLGTTPGTVLEGRTFGTAANSAVGDFIQNQNSSAQSANMWINGQITTGKRSIFNANDDNIQLVLNRSNSNIGSGGLGANASNYFMVLDVASGLTKFSISTSGASTFSSTVNSTGFLLNGNNLTSSLTTNYIPKWNGSSLVNATAGTDYQLPITLTTNGTSGAATFENGVLNVPNYGSGATSGTYVPALTNYSNIASSSAFEAMYMHIGNMYSLSIKAVITPSASGSCILRITLPQQSNNKAGVFSVTSISNDQSTVLPSFTSTVGSGDYVDVVVTVPSTAPITLTVTGMYTHQ